MGRAARREHLARLLNTHSQGIHETFQVFDRPAASSLEKVEWSQVTKLGDEISKQATIAGMLWTGEAPDVRELAENIGVYCNMLQGFLLLSHGTTVGAGPTLQASIHASAKPVIERSLSLLKEAVSSYESHDSDKRVLIPQLSGSVWEACAALKKTPTTNCMAIGRAITRVAVSVKDVLREMRELTPASTEASETACESHGDDGSNDGDDDLGNDLSAEEMAIAELTITVVSDTLAIIKEAIRFLTGLLLKKPHHDIDAEYYVASLERLLKRYQDIGVQVDDIGACVYPPQEVSQMKTTAEKMLDDINGIRAEVGILEGSPEGLLGALDGSEISLMKLQLGLTCLVDSDLVPEMGRLAV